MHTETISPAGCGTRPRFAPSGRCRRHPPGLWLAIESRTSGQSKDDSNAQLDVSGRAHTPIPHPKGWAGHVRVESAGTKFSRVRKDVPVPDVEELASDFD